MNQYYEALTGKPFDLKDAARNWAVKTKALQDNNADKKITAFLVHIRNAYRNPITHPDIILESGEAFSFLSQAISIISLMLTAVKKINEERQPMLDGLFDKDFAGLLPTGEDVEPIPIEEIDTMPKSPLDEPTAPKSIREIG
jgi:hypothetical protein